MTKSTQNFDFTLNYTRFDENYIPKNNTRITTNFANLARGENRQENLRNTLKMIDHRFNTLASWDNPNGDRYAIELDIVSAGIDIEGNGKTFPTIEILKTTIIDKQKNKRFDGIVGNNFSSYVRDYDFSVLLLAYNKDKPTFSVPENFGDLHGKMFNYFLQSAQYQSNFHKPPVICLSVSDHKVYHRTPNQHPILGVEYLPNENSLTEQYFKKMHLQVRYFMPPNAVAPLAFYFIGDLLNDYTNLELISTISTMETFQKIYRPEIYNANAIASECYQPSLKNADYSLTQIVYDRQERSQLAIEQGKYAEINFIKPYKAILDEWSTNYPL